MKKELLAFALLTLLSTSVFAASTDATVETIANTIIREIDGMPDFLSAFSYVAGVALGIKALLKFKEHNESKGQVKMSIPIILIVASALFLGLPTVLRIGIDTAGYQEVQGAKFKYEY